MALKVLVETAPLRERLMILGSAGVSHLVTFEESHTRYAQPLIVHQGSTDRPQRVYRNRLSLPRARIVGGVLTYDGDAGYIGAVETGPDDLFARVALVETSEFSRLEIPIPAAPSFHGPPRVAGKAQIVEDQGRRIRITTRGDGGYLVVNDTLVPGWEATVDGQPVPFLRADYVFRAIPVPSGEHEVTMTYSPW